MEGLKACACPLLLMHQFCRRSGLLGTQRCIGTAQTAVEGLRSLYELATRASQSLQKFVVKSTVIYGCLWVGLPSNEMPLTVVKCQKPVVPQSPQPDPLQLHFWTAHCSTMHAIVHSGNTARQVLD